MSFDVYLSCFQNGELAKFLLACLIQSAANAEPVPRRNQKITKRTQFIV